MSCVDLVIFGATGYTGSVAVGVMTDILKNYKSLSWAVAGRNQSKLESLLQDISKKTGNDLSSVKIIIADVNDEESLRGMCKQTRVVLDFCGPFRFYGEQVVKAAIECKTHYIDVSGETQFIETMQLKYDQLAKDAGVFVISACGFDSIPNDMGVVFLQQQFNGTLNSVESYLELNPPQYLTKEEYKNGYINYGTWESLVYSLAHAKEMVDLRKQLNSERLPSFKPKLQPRPTLHMRNDAYYIPFLGSDKAIVNRTQRHLYLNNKIRPVQFYPYVKTGSRIYTLISMFLGFILLTLSKWKVTRKLLLDYPKVFSFGFVTRDGPSSVLMENTEFSVTLCGEGWDSGADVDNTPPNKKMVARVSGKDPGYGLTAKAVILSGLTVLTQKDKMPNTGGVLTTGAAFHNTDLIENLNRHNMKFEIIASE